MVYRLEAKKAIRRVKKIGNAHIFEAAISRASAQRRVIDELLALFGGRSQPVMAHLIETGKLTLEDVQQAEQTLRKFAKKDRSLTTVGDQRGDPLQCLDFPVDARGLVAAAPLGDASRPSTGGVGAHGTAGRKPDGRVPALTGHALRPGKGHRRQGARSTAS